MQSRTRVINKTVELMNIWHSLRPQLQGQTVAAGDSDDDANGHLEDSSSFFTPAQLTALLDEGLLPEADSLVGIQRQVQELEVGKACYMSSNDLEHCKKETADLQQEFQRQRAWAAFYSDRCKQRWDGEGKGNALLLMLPRNPHPCGLGDFPSMWASDLASKRPALSSKDGELLLIYKYMQLLKGMQKGLDTVS
jgi:hypothetical protein